VRESFCVVVGADAVHLAVQHQVLCVGAVAGEEHGLVVLVDEHADLARGVARDGYEGDVAGFGQVQAPWERPQWLLLELEQGWLEPGWPVRVRDVAAQPSAQAGCELELRPRDEDLGVGEVVQAAGVVGVKVGHHEPAHIARTDAEPLELGADLLCGLDPFAEAANARMPAGEVAGLGGTGGLARVDHDHALGMLDRERVDRKRLGPLAVKQRVHEPEPAVPHALAPLRRNRDGTGLDCVYLHEVSFFRLVGFVCGAKPRRISSTTPSASCSSIGPPVINSR